MNAPANVRCVMCECPIPGFVVLCESVSAFFHTNPSLLSF